MNEDYYNRKLRTYYPVLALIIVLAFWCLVVWAIGRFF